MINIARNLFRRAFQAPARNNRRRLYHRQMSMESLECRQMPAVMVNAGTLSYQDVDGDDVTVQFNKNFLTAANVNTIFTFSSGAGAVNGSNAAKEQLQKITLTGVAGAALTTITTTATKSAANGGDGYAALGQIDASAMDLGAVMIDGDLGRIKAGDFTASTTGLNGLTVQSMGVFGTSTGAENLSSVVNGKVAALTVKGHLKGTNLYVDGDANGQIGSITIEGSMIGTSDAVSGRIHAEGDIGSLLVKGSILGNAGERSGNISSGGKIGPVTVNGSVKGGSGENSGRIFITGDIGAVNIKGNLEAGSGSPSGFLRSTGGNIASVAIGGSCLTTGPSDIGHFKKMIESFGDIGTITIPGAVTGTIYSAGKMGAVSIGSLPGDIFAIGAIASVKTTGSLIGLVLNGGYGGGTIESLNTIGDVLIGGSVVGGSGFSGNIFASVGIGAVKIEGDLIGHGEGFPTGGGGSVGSDGPITSVYIGGSINGGAKDYTGYVSGSSIGSVTVKGKIVGGTIPDGRNGAIVTKNGDLGAVTIDGGMEGGLISSAKNIASVTLGGSLIGGLTAKQGKIVSVGDIGPIIVHGISGGTGQDAGAIISGGKIGNVTVIGSITGGAGNGSGSIRSTGDMGVVTVQGSVVGQGAFSGYISCGGKMTALNMDGSIIGGGDFAGRVQATGEITTVDIKGDIVGGSAVGFESLTRSGYLGASRIPTLTLGGSLIAGIDATVGSFSSNGAIRVTDDLGTVLIKGDLQGHTSNPAIISARGKAGVVAGAADVAILSLTVNGNVEYAQILAGVDTSGLAKNADAQITTLKVDGDWIASSAAAGTVAGADGKFGTADDTVMTGIAVKNDGVAKSKISTVTIGHQALGTVGGSDRFGFVSQQIGSLSVGGTAQTLTAALDDFFIGITGDLKVLELP